MESYYNAIKMLLARTLIALCMVTLSGCFTAFAPRSNSCTIDPENTAVRLCTQEEIKGMTDWKNKINEQMKR